MLVDALQYIHEIRVGVNAVQFAGHQQALDDTDLAGAKLSPAEEPVAPLMETFP